MANDDDQNTTHDVSDHSAEGGLSHLDAEGRASMVDVSAKPETVRQATARGLITMAEETAEHVRAHGVKKGDLIGVARIAGIMAAKQTHMLIPLCHPLPLDKIGVRFAWTRTAAQLAEGDTGTERPALLVEGLARTRASTGVEMEALTAVQIACLTLYDMLKAIDRTLEIGHVHLVQKSGGRSGDYDTDTVIPGIDETALEWL